MSILVTGGAGFIGSHLTGRLLKEGLRVVCLDNFDPYYDPKTKRRNISPYLTNEKLRLIKGDVRDTKILKNILTNEDVRKVVHLAAKVGVRPSIQTPQEYESVNIKGTLKLLEVCKNFEIENFVFGSSSSVYGISKEIPFKEDGPIKPISPYATSKRSAELLCYTYHHLFNIPIVCLRFFTVYGPRQRPEMAIHKFTRQIRKGKKIEMYGDGTSKRDYTYIDDIIDGVMNALNKNFNFEIFNLGNSETVKLNKMIALIEKALGKGAKIKQVPEQGGDVPITYADIAKARKLLDYDPKVRIEKGIKIFVEWYENLLL